MGLRVRDKALLFLLIIGVALGPVSVAQPIKAQTDTWVVGIDRYYPPHEYWENGTARGFNVDLIEAVAAAMGKTMVWKPLVWEEAPEALLNGTVDSLCMAVTPEREVNFSFSRPILNLTLRVFVRTDMGGITCIEDLAGHTVAVEENDIAHDTLEKRVPNATIVLVETQDEAIRLVAEGEVTAAFCNEYAGVYAAVHNNFANIKKIGDPVYIGPRAIAVRKNDTVLLKEIDAALAEVFSSGEYNRLFQQWFGQDIAASAATGEVLRGILFVLLGAVGLVLVVGVWNWSLHKRVQSVTERLAFVVDLFRHDFRNISQSVLYSLELIEHETKSPRQREMLTTAIAELHRAQMLIDDLTKIDMITSGKLACEAYNMSVMIEQAVDVLTATIPNVTVNLKTGHRPDVLVEASDQLPDVLFRLMRFMAGSHNSSTHLQVLTKEDRWTVHIYIGREGGEGSGVVERSMLLRYHGVIAPGIGLDLSLAHAVITSCHGWIEVEESRGEEGVHRVFHVTLRKILHTTCRCGHSS
ncbi:MAG: transporter substrate-binding domain-containing protein [Candidatus Thorarchaeota archaeon]